MIKKHKILRKLKPTDEIIKRDDQTFYVPSSDPEKEHYMVFHSQNGKWFCDCMAFTFNDKEDCKHIIRIKSEV